MSEFKYPEAALDELSEKITILAKEISEKHNINTMIEQSCFFLTYLTTAMIGDLHITCSNPEQFARKKKFLINIISQEQFKESN